MTRTVLLSLLVLTILATALPAHAQPNRPCRFQVRKADGNWSGLVGVRAKAQAVAEGTEYRKAPLTRRFVPRFIRCLAGRYGVSKRKALSVAWCESKFERYATSGAGHLGVWQMDSGWGTAQQRYHPWWSTRRALLYVRNNSWNPWSCS